MTVSSVGSAKSADATSPLRGADWARLKIAFANASIGRSLRNESSGLAHSGSGAQDKAMTAKMKRMIVMPVGCRSNMSASEPLSHAVRYDDRTSAQGPGLIRSHVGVLTIEP